MKFNLHLDSSDVKYSSELLVELLQDRNEDAFDYFTEYYFNRIYNYIRKRVNSNELAVDMTFDTCRRIFIKIDDFQYRSDEAFESWIYKNAQSVIYLYYRHLETEKNYNKYIVLDNEYVETFVDPSSSESISDEILEIVYLCLNSRELYIVIQHIYEKTSFKDIAKELGCTTSAVSNTFYRSIKKCRKYLENYSASIYNT